MSERDLSQVLNTARQLAQADMPAAIETLQSIRDRSDFFPWGAHILLEYYCSNVRYQNDDARALAREMGRRCPEFFASWWSQIQLARGTEDYYRLCSRLVSEFRDSELPPDKKFLFTPFLECLLERRPNDAHELVRRLFLAPGFIREIDALCVGKVVDFLSLVAKEKFIQCDNGQKFYWQFGFSGRQDVLLRNEASVLVVNLSPLGVDGLEGWDFGLAGAVTVATSSIMGWAPYFDDRGTASWNTISDNDRFGAVFWRLVVSPFEWLDLRPRNERGVAVESPPAVRRVQFSIANLEHRSSRLFVRPGNGEIWALWSALNAPQQAEEAAEEVAALALRARAAGQMTMPKRERPWTNAVANIIQLNMNGGWYAKPGRAAQSFSDWAARYGAALCNGQILAAHDVELLPIAALLPEFRHQSPQHWTDVEVLRLLDGSRVVFVSAFAQEIRAHEQTGKLRALWRDLDFNVQLQSLNTVSAPMSIWPYYPHDCWSETFNLLCEDSAHAIQTTGANLFIASCGAYGLPLVHEMHKLFKICSIYCGHESNICFGIVTRAAKNNPLFTRNRNSRNWLFPDLAERFPEVSSIDDGRYVRIDLGV